MARALALALALLAASPAAAAPGPAPAAPAPAAAPAMPRGSKPDGDRTRSALGFRATVDHFEKQFHKGGRAVRRIGPYQVAGVDVVRFLALDAHPPWRAVHVYRIAGVTWIAVIPVPLDAAGPTE